MKFGEMTWPALKASDKSNIVPVYLVDPAERCLVEEFRDEHRPGQSNQPIQGLTDGA